MILKGYKAWIEYHWCIHFDKSDPGNIITFIYIHLCMYCVIYINYWYKKKLKHLQDLGSKRWDGNPRVSSRTFGLHNQISHTFVLSNLLNFMMTYKKVKISLLDLLPAQSRVGRGFCRHCVLGGGTQRLALPRYLNEEMKI